MIDHVVKPDLAAPGNRVVSLLAPNSTLVGAYPSLDVYPCNSTGSQCNSSYGAPQYFRLSGTSMATPVVSGVYAPSAVWKGALVLLPTMVLTYVYFLNRSAHPVPAMMVPSSAEEEYPAEVSS